MHRRIALSRVWFSLVLALAAPGAATTLDFEDLGLNLPVNSDPDPELEYYYNGYSAYSASQPTAFSSSGANFNNEFSDFGGGCCFAGWAYSQTTDGTTPGFENQYSAIPGSGAGGSATYGVAYTAGGAEQAAITRITFDQPTSLVDVAITNTTYAALAMRDGYFNAKQFGGPTGSDPDYFLLTITGRDAGNAITGSVEFALADFRFANHALDYIVMEWVLVDLTSLGSISALEFALESSDVGEFGMNTPAYFALDVVPEPGSGALLALGLALLARRRS